MAKVSVQITAATQDAVNGIKRVDVALSGLRGAGALAHGTLTELNSGLALAQRAFGAVKAAVESVINPVVEYGKQVKDLSRSIGATSQESSKLIQAADDVFVSVSTLETGLKAAIRNGVEPTIEGISALADEYLTLQPGIERTKFLMDNFGRSGADLAPLMEKGADGIRELGDAAEAAGLVMDDEGVAKAMAYKEAMDGLNDSVLALKMTIADVALPGLVNYIGAMTEQINVFRLANQALEEGKISAREYAAIQLSLIYNTNGHADEMYLLSERLREQKDAWGEASLGAANWETLMAHLTGQSGKAIDAYAARWQGLADHIADVEKAQRNAALAGPLAAGMAGTLTSAQEAYQQVLAETQPEIEKLTADIARMNAANGTTWTVTTEAKHSVAEYELAQIKAATAAQKLAEFSGDSREELLGLQIAADNAAQRVAQMGTEMGISETFTADYTKKIMEANGTLGELEAKQLAAEEALRRATAQFLFQQAAASLDNEAALALARSMGLIDEASFVAAEQMRLLTEEYQKTGDLDTYTTKSAELRDVIASLQSRNIEITVTTIQREINIREYREEQANVQAAQDAEDAYYGTRASGGTVMAGKPYLVGERGPEPFIPATNGRVVSHEDAMRALSGGGGQSVTINVYGAVGQNIEQLANLISRKLGGQAQNRRLMGA